MQIYIQFTTTDNYFIDKKTKFLLERMNCGRVYISCRQYKMNLKTITAEQTPSDLYQIRFEAKRVFANVAKHFYLIQFP